CRAKRVSVGPGGVDFDGNSGAPVLAPDGRSVAFITIAPSALPMFAATDLNGRASWVLAGSSGKLAFQALDNRPYSAIKGTFIGWCGGDAAFLFDRDPRAQNRIPVLHFVNPESGETREYFLPGINWE